MSGIVDAHQMAALLRISAEIDVVGDVTITVAHPADLVAWAHVLDNAHVGAWRASDSGHRFVQVVAASKRSPVHGQVSAVLDCAAHEGFWTALLDNADLEPGQTRALSVRALVDGWVSATTTGPPG